MTLGKSLCSKGPSEGVRVRTAHIKIGGIVLHYTDARYPGLRGRLEGMEANTKCKRGRKYTMPSGWRKWRKDIKVGVDSLVSL